MVRVCHCACAGYYSETERIPGACFQEVLMSHILALEASVPESSKRQVILWIGYIDIRPFWMTSCTHCQSQKKRNVPALWTATYRLRYEAFNLKTENAITCCLVWYVEHLRRWRLLAIEQWRNVINRENRKETPREAYFSANSSTWNLTRSHTGFNATSIKLDAAPENMWRSTHGSLKLWRFLAQSQWKFGNVRVLALPSLCPTVRMYPCNNSRTTGRILIKFDIYWFL
jgi:hypothetical protein